MLFGPSLPENVWSTSPCNPFQSCHLCRPLVLQMTNSGRNEATLRCEQDVPLAKLGKIRACARSVLTFH